MYGTSKNGGGIEFFVNGSTRRLLNKLWNLIELAWKNLWTGQFRPWIGSDTSGSWTRLGSQTSPRAGQIRCNMYTVSQMNFVRSKQARWVYVHRGATGNGVGSGNDDKDSGWLWRTPRLIRDTEEDWALALQWPEMTPTRGGVTGKSWKRL